LVKGSKIFPVLKFGIFFEKNFFLPILLLQKHLGVYPPRHFRGELGVTSHPALSMYDLKVTSEINQR
jgi:hypothetical protein